MVVSVVVGLRNISIEGLEGFQIMRSRKRTLIPCLGLSFVCTYLDCVFVADVRVCSFGVVYV